jgi:hypothetical protein
MDYPDDFHRLPGLLPAYPRRGRGSVLRQPPGDNTNSRSVCYAAVELHNRRLYGMYFSYPLLRGPLSV